MLGESKLSASGASGIFGSSARLTVSRREPRDCIAPPVPWLTSPGSQHLRQRTISFAAPTARPPDRIQLSGTGFNAANPNGNPGNFDYGISFPRGATPLGLTPVPRRTDGDAWQVARPDALN